VDAQRARIWRVTERGIAWFLERGSLGDSQLPSYSTHVDGINLKEVGLTRADAIFTTYAFLIEASNRELYIYVRVLGRAQNDPRYIQAVLRTIRPDETQLESQAQAALRIAPGVADENLLRNAYWLARTHRLPLAVVAYGNVPTLSNARTAYMLTHISTPLGWVAHQLYERSAAVIYL
jgi:hypothetical protein